MVIQSMHEGHCVLLEGLDEYTGLLHSMHVQLKRAGETMYIAHVDISNWFWPTTRRNVTHGGGGGCLHFQALPLRQGLPCKSEVFPPPIPCPCVNRCGL